MTLPCVKNPITNCCDKSGNCDHKKCGEGHICCAQEPSLSGGYGSATLGICVKKDAQGGMGNCDKKKGLPVKDCQEDTKNNVNIPVEKYENFIVHTNEGYNDDNCDCDKWNNAFIVLFVVLMLLILVISMLYLASLRK
jgi:hypothetical protein